MEQAPSPTVVPKHNLYAHRQGPSPHPIRGNQEGPAKILLPADPTQARGGRRPCSAVLGRPKATSEHASRRVLTLTSWPLIYNSCLSIINY